MAKQPTEEDLNQAAQTSEAKPSLRDEIRAKVLAQVKPISLTITLGGVDLEWRQPSIQQTQDARAARGDNADDENFIVRMILDYTYIPDTDEKVFTPDDYANVMGMGFGGEYQKAITKIAKALDLTEEVEEKAKNSDKTQNGGTS